MFEIVFYLFSSILAYIDYKSFLVPNKILIVLFVLLIVFGLYENKLNLISFFISFGVLAFFIAVMLLNPKMVLGGGDIKYMMVVAIFLQPILFPFFLITTGVMQSLSLLYAQVALNKQKVAMLPAMLLSVVITVLFYNSTLFPFSKVIGE